MGRKFAGKRLRRKEKQVPEQRTRWEASLKRRSVYPPSMITVLLFVSGLALISCGSREAETNAERLRPYAVADTQGAVDIDFPSFVTSKALDGYRFAVKYPAVLNYMPCYCGCGLTQGHMSSLDCFITGIDGKGIVVFTDHATHCDICLEIARDARNLLQQGKSLVEIRMYVDRVHGEKGPGTDTPRPKG